MPVLGMVGLANTCIGSRTSSCVTYGFQEPVRAQNTPQHLPIMRQHDQVEMLLGISSR